MANTLVEDPTRKEMLEFLGREFPAPEYDKDAYAFDVEEAIFWFAYAWHGGQWSNLYSALSTSEYRPGPMTYEPENCDMMNALESRFCHV